MSRLSGREIAKLKRYQKQVNQAIPNNIIAVTCDDSHIQSIAIAFHSSNRKENEKIVRLILPAIGIPYNNFEIVGG